MRKELHIFIDGTLAARPLRPDDDVSECFIGADFTVVSVPTMIRGTAAALQALHGSTPIAVGDQLQMTYVMLASADLIGVIHWRMTRHLADQLAISIRPASRGQGFGARAVDIYRYLIGDVFNIRENVTEIMHASLPARRIARRRALKIVGQRRREDGEAVHIVRSTSETYRPLPPEMTFSHRFIAVEEESVKADIDFMEGIEE